MLLRSLSQQRVNSLVWEVEHDTRAPSLSSCACLALTCDEGTCRASFHVTRRRSSSYSLGANMHKLRWSTLHLIRLHKPVLLAVPSELRLPRGFHVAFTEISGGSADSATSRAIAFRRSGVSDMAAPLRYQLQENSVQAASRMSSLRISSLRWRDVSTCAA